jgi:hypothetical protein
VIVLSFVVVAFRPSQASFLTVLLYSRNLTSKVPFTYLSWKTLSNHVFEDLRKPKAPNRVQNKSQANKKCDTRICFTKVRFSQTYSPLRWSQRSGLFQPFPSLKRSLGPSELSLLKSTGNKTSPQGPPHNWCLLPWLQVSFDHKKRMIKRKAIQAQELKRTRQITLTSH